MPRTTVDLNGSEWRLGPAPRDADPGRASWGEIEQVAEWLPATVPGNVQADLVDLGQLPDPNRAYDARAFRRAGERSWWLTRRFPSICAPGDRTRLIVRGMDYVGDILLNGQFLGRHEGMFAPQEHEITHIQQAENRLAIRLLGMKWLPRGRSTPWGKLLNRTEARWGGLPGDYPHRRDTLKCQMQFGWDFAPPLLTMGLWDDVYVACSGSTYIHSMHTSFEPARPGAGPSLAIHLILDSPASREVRLVARLQGETFSQPEQESDRDATLRPGRSPVAIQVPVLEPRLWWPWDLGEPNLYRLTVEVWDEEHLLDSLSRTIGLREFRVEDYRLRANGQPLYARGANWVPAGLFPGRVTAQDYARLLGMARNANMNMLRVWAGGLREKRAFYDQCDRLGLLVWQEFPFACAFLTRFPRSPDYLGLVRDEAQGIVRDLRHHACLAIWSGGNEFSVHRNAQLVNTLRNVAAVEDPGSTFLPVSPNGGDHHNWLVWHGHLPPSAYRRDDAHFASEFGLQSPPSTESWSGFLSSDQQWPPGDAWRLHGAGLGKLWRYARPFLPDPLHECRNSRWTETTPEAFVHASQQAQLHGLKIAIEHFRRRKAAGCGGVLVWQLNEPWPAISWAVIPFWGEPKPAYRALHQLYSPLFVSLAYPLRDYSGGGRFSAEVWVINDTAADWPGCALHAALYDENGRRVEVTSWPVDVPASSAAAAARVNWQLPEGNRWLVSCSLSRCGKVVATNQYDLGHLDDIQPTPGQRLWRWLTGLVNRL